MQRPLSRRQHHEAVIVTLRGITSPKVVLLDPDTGIAPSKPSGKHVSPEDVTAVWHALTAGDWLAVYQHRSRRKAWREEARNRLAALCGADVRVYSAPEVAPDAVFLRGHHTDLRNASGGDC